MKNYLKNVIFLTNNAELSMQCEKARNCVGFSGFGRSSDDMGCTIRRNEEIHIHPRFYIIFHYLKNDLKNFYPKIARTASVSIS